MSVKPLSTVELKKKLPINTILYKDLKNLRSLDDIIKPNGCILLYQLHYPIGHFTTLFENKEGLNYFDPLGFIPDRLLKTNFDHPEGRESMGADFTYLNQLLLEFLNEHDYDKITFNEQKLQPINSNTCGYWCLTRLYFKDLTNDEFNDYFMSMPIKKREEKVVKFYNKL